MPNPVDSYALTVADSGSLSNAVQIDEGIAAGLIAPYISGSSVVYLQVSASETGSYVPVYDADGATRWSLAIGPSGSAAAIDVLAPFVFAKVETDIPMVGAQEFTIVTKLSEKNRVHGWYGMVPR